MQIRARLLSGQWFSHLPLSFQDSLLALARERRLTAGQRLFQRGDAPCGLYAVLGGAVRIGAVSEQGKEALLSLVEAPHSRSVCSMVSRAPMMPMRSGRVPC